MAYLNAVIDQKLEHVSKAKYLHRIDHKIMRLDLEWNIKREDTDMQPESWCLMI